MSKNGIQRTAAEFILITFIVAIAGALVYDCFVTYENTVSVYYMTVIYTHPMLAFVSGALVMFLCWITHKVWEMPFRRVIVLVAVGICLGHLTWAQDPQRKAPSTLPAVASPPASPPTAAKDK